jgi:hypothetical protein
LLFLNRILLAGFFLTGLSLPAVAEQINDWSLNEWDARLDKDGIEVYTRPGPEPRYKEFKGSTEIEATVAHAVALLEDHSACSNWLHRCSHSRLVEEVSATRRVFYQVTELPFPAKSRDAVFLATITYAQDKSVKISMSPLPDRVESTKLVRVRNAFGSYLLEPVSDTRTRVTWQMYVNPAGALPAWLVNSMLIDLPYRSLKKFRELVRQSPYNRAYFRYDEDGTPVEILYSG